MKRFSRLVFVVVAFAWLVGCKYDDVAPVNPCPFNSPVNADFSIEEEIWRKYNAEKKTSIYYDTVLVGSRVYFRSIGEWDEYNWSILGDPSFKRTSREFFIFVGEEMVLDIQLIAKNNDKKCFPGKTATDTVIKRVVFVGKKRDPLVGNYWGSDLSDPNYGYNIRFVYDTMIDLNSVSIWVGNFPDGCPYNVAHDQSGSGYRIFYITNFGPQHINNYCGSPTGWGLLQDDLKTLFIDYKILDLPNGRGVNNPISKKYVGTKK